VIIINQHNILCVLVNPPSFCIQRQDKNSVTIRVRYLFLTELKRFQFVVYV